MNDYVARVNLPDRVVAIIPCFNEARTIGALVRGVRRHVAAVIVVDDGSEDATASEAASSGAKVLRHKQNRGKGVAIETGLLAAVAQGFGHGLLLDGDGQHRTEDIPALLGCARETGAALVVGNRMHKPMAMSRLRRWVNRWMSARISKLAGKTLPDTQCGFRVVNLAVWRGLSLRAERFEIESEMILGFVRRGHRVEFVPIQTSAGTRRSHIQPIRDTWRWLKWWREVSRASSVESAGVPPESKPSLVCQ